MIDLFVSMDHVLSFVEDVDKLKGKGERYFDLIEESLRVIGGSASLLLKYINATTKGTKVMDYLDLHLLFARPK